MKQKSIFSKFLTNRWVLNIVSIIALFNVIGYMIIGDFNTVLYFIIIAVLVRYFSKNMIVVLGIPLIIVNFMSLKRNSYMEGMENNESTSKESDTANTTTTTTNPSTSTTTTTTTEPASSTGKKDAFEVGHPKNGKYKIDYASTIEEAYDQLNSILGADGIKSLTDDTQRLLEQQTQLAGSLKNMGPMIEKMGPMVKSLTSMVEQFDTNGSNGEVMKNINSIVENLKNVKKN
jgi:hypothetical protein